MAAATSALPRGWVAVRGKEARANLAALGVAVHFDAAVNARLFAELFEAERVFGHAKSASVLGPVEEFLRAQGMNGLADMVRMSIETHERETRGEDVPDRSPRLDRGYLTLRGESGVVLLQCPGDDIPNTQSRSSPMLGSLPPERWRPLDFDGKPLVVSSWEWVGPAGLVKSLLFQVGKTEEIEWPATAT